MEEKICPYPGLRPFNDDESIFFKGRERNIDTIIELFEQKKFMMLTGASGDGKSSLVYAGIVPNARAGLFKAKYNNWIVADFKPERTPLENLTLALNAHFKYDDLNQLKEELSLGFSSLTRIYKNSPFYINEENSEWIAAEDVKKKQLKRKASNLLIIADQFEEFFTNSENFIDGAASVESQTVINVLLETAKIALAEDLPIYVVCTMRSDYIGQCAAFRGLPEYIGFSQFFVPRLKRKEIQQVIEEPAQLNGDKISDRLIQRLLYDISDGLDQLPILQHALNQIWKMADNGKYEMDLIHYAKVGGLPANELPPEDRDIFAIWFANLPDFKKQLFAHPSLENILNAHANELLEFAYQNFIERNPGLSDKISQDQTKKIIKTTFQCLTKIDASRAVRNRMTLQEITDIINDSSIDVKMVGKILDIFREQGNTFIKPFITSDIQTLKTHKHTVLDITHESLIRNWDILKIWAYEEFDNWSNFQDFNKQLQRWIKSGKTSGYLLPIGPLTFFENWYDTCKPNKHWLARYEESEHPFEEKVKNTEENLREADAFLKASAKKLFITRTVMKYGANKILAIFGLLILFGACTYYYNDYRKKQNDVVLANIEKKGLGMLRSNKIKPKVKADFVIAYERLHPGSFNKVLSDLKCDTLAYDIAFEMFLKCQNIDDFNKIAVNPIVFELIDYLDNSLTKIYSDKEYIKNDFLFKRVTEFVRLCAFIKSYQKDEHTSIDSLMGYNIDRLYSDYLLAKLNTLDTSVSFNPVIFNSAIELTINYSYKRTERVAEILGKLSPFENEVAKRKFDKFYAKDKILTSYGNGNLTHNGGYQELAYLYAFSGMTKPLVNCMDSLAKYNKNYFNYYQSIPVVYYLFCSKDFNEYDIDEFMNYMIKKTNSKKSKFIQRLVKSAKPFIDEWQLELSKSITNAYTNTVNSLVCNYSDKMFNYYLKAIEQDEQKRDELYFKLAIFYKERGIHKSTPNEIREKCFKQAIQKYKLVSAEYLAMDHIIGNSFSSDNKRIKKSVFFLYPISIPEDNTWSLFDLWGNISNEMYFVDYLLKNKTISTMLLTKEDWNSYETFLYNYFSTFNTRNKVKEELFNYSYYHFAEEEIVNNKTAKAEIDSNFIYLVRTNEYFEKLDTTNAFKFYNKVNLMKVLSVDFQKEEDSKGNVHKFLLKSIAKKFTVYGKNKLAAQILSSIYEPYFKRNTLIDIAFELNKKGKTEDAFVYLDSLYKQIDNEPKYGLRLLQLNALVGGQKMLNLSNLLIKDINDKIKPRALVLFIRGIANSGLYYLATKQIPNYVSSANELELYTEIVKAKVHSDLDFKLLKNVKFKNPFEKYDMNDYGINWWGDEESEREIGTIISSED